MSATVFPSAVVLFPDLALYPSAATYEPDLSTLALVMVPDDVAVPRMEGM